MPKQVHELPAASVVNDSDKTNIKQGLNDRYATVAQINDNIGTAIERADDKATPVDADIVALSDSAASNILKKLSWANIKSTLKSYFESVVFTWALRQIFTTGIKLPVNEAVRFANGNISTVGDFDMSEVTTADALIQFFRNTNTSGNRKLIIYSGDGTASIAFSFDAATSTFQISGNTVWHSGNDGSGSGLDADTVDGADIGTAIGEIVQLEDVGGNPGLPAVDGSQLTNLPVDQDVRVSATDTTPGFLDTKITAGDGITLDILNPADDESLEINVALEDTPAMHLIVRAASNGQTVISFGQEIVDDSSGTQGAVKNHLVFRNGQLLINGIFDSLISPETGNYLVTDTSTGEITLQSGSEAQAGDIFTYISITKTTTA